MKIGNRSSESVPQSKYLGMTITEENLIQEEIKRRLTGVMVATIQSRTFCLLACCLKT
jgi:hypothetical protein